MTSGRSLALQMNNIRAMSTTAPSKVLDAVLPRTSGDHVAALVGSTSQQPKRPTSSPFPNQWPQTSKANPS